MYAYLGATAVQLLKALLCFSLKHDWFWLVMKDNYLMVLEGEEEDEDADKHTGRAYCICS